MNLGSISNPPANSSIRLERTDDALEFSGASRNVSQEEMRAKAEEFMASLPAAGLIRGVLSGGPRGCVLVFFGLGLIPGLAVPAFILYTSLQDPDADRAAVGFIVAAALMGVLIWAGVGIVLFRRLGRMSSPEHREARMASLPWQLEITPHQIQTTQERLVGVNDDYRICRPEDVRSLSISPEGYLVAHLAGGSGGSETEMPLTGSLERAEADWLQNSLTGLLGLGGTAQPQAPAPEAPPVTKGEVEARIPEDFRILSEPSSGRLAIAHHPAQGLGEKVVGVIIFLIFGAAFGGSCLYLGLGNLEEIRTLPLPHWAALFGVFLLLCYGIFSQGRSRRRRARGRDADVSDHVADAGKWGIAAVLLLVVEAAILIIAFRNLDKLLETPLSLWFSALALLAGIGFVLYFGSQVLWVLFGSTEFVATGGSLRIRRKLAFLGMSKQIGAQELERFELTELIHRDEGVEHRYWGLAAVGARTVSLLSRESEFDTADWLGRTLAEWFKIPFVRAHEKKAIRSTRYHDL